MPTLLFSLDEIAGPLVVRQRELSKEIRELADLKVTPLNPGESVGDRYHRIAKLGKQLADAVAAFDALMCSRQPAAEAEPSEPPAPDTSQAN